MNVRSHSTHLSIATLCIMVALQGCTLKSKNYNNQPPENIIKPQKFLDCQRVGRLTKTFVGGHYNINKFDDELSKRTFKTYLSFLDSAKYIFLQKDINFLQRKFELRLDDQIPYQKCHFITEAFNLYIKRLTEVNKIAETMLKKKKPFDFSKDEKVRVKTDDQPWPKDEATRKEVLRKYSKLRFLNLRKAGDNDEKASGKVLRFYQRQLKRMKEKTPSEINSFFMKSFALSLDPHSSYLEPIDEQAMKESFQLHYVGIGATLQQEDGFTIVKNLIPGGSAIADGRLKPEDKIVTVKSKDKGEFIDVVDMDLSKVVSLIKGPEKTKVVLGILRKNEKGKMVKLRIDLNRTKIELKNAEASGSILNIDKKKIGVIKLPSFYVDYNALEQKNPNYKSAAKDVSRELAKLKKENVNGIIIDLRNNGGGDLNQSIILTGLFLKGQTVVRVKSRNGVLNSYDDRDKSSQYNGPLAVLINKSSASASEILSGALRDHGRAIILGDSSTYGKGTVQQVNSIPGTEGRRNDGAYKITTSTFFMPSGHSNQEKGVPSHLTIPSIHQASEYLEKNLPYVIPWSEIKIKTPPVPFINFDKYVGDLQKKSDARVKGNKDFEEIMKLVSESKKNRDFVDLKWDEKEGITEVKSDTTKKDEKKKDGAKDDDKKKEEDKDIILKEAAHILLDAIQVIKKDNWIK